MPSPTGHAEADGTIRAHGRATPAAMDADRDFELLERWRDGDQGAGSELLARYFNLLRVYFLSRVPEREVEDLIQEVFLRMVEALDRFEGRCSVKTFLIRIARNVVRETLRALYRPDGRVDPFDESLHAMSGRTLSAVYAKEEALQLLLDAMQYITTGQYDIIELHYFHEFTYSEIADALELPLGTVKSRMGAARRKLLEEFMVLLGPEAEAWTEDALEDSLKKVRDAVLRGKARKLE